MLHLNLCKLLLGECSPPLKNLTEDISPCEFVVGFLLVISKINFCKTSIFFVLLVFNEVVGNSSGIDCFGETR